MANDKKFIAKNGFLTSDAESNFTNSTAATPTVTFTNSGGQGSSSLPGSGAVIAKFVGNNDAMVITNISDGDYFFGNNQQNNGINFYDGSGGMEFYYDGVEKFSIDSNGTTFATGHTTNGTTTTNRLKVEDNGSTSPLVVVKADDANPWALTIGNDTYSTTEVMGHLFYQANAGDTYYQSRGSGAYVNWNFQQHDGSTARTQMRIASSGHIELASNHYVLWGVGGTDRPGFLGDNTNKVLQFHNNGAERMRLDSSGNVGIGTTDPNQRFHAYHATTNVVGKIESGDDEVWLALTDVSTDTYGTLIGRKSSTNTLFKVADEGVVERFTILEGGAVGIGSTNPQYKLDVNGTSRVTGGLTVSPGSSGHTSFELGSRSADPLPAATGSYDFKPGMRVGSYELGGINAAADIAFAWSTDDISTSSPGYLAASETYATASWNESFTVTQKGGTRWFVKVKLNDPESGNDPRLAVNNGTEYRLEYADAVNASGEAVDDSDTWHVIDVTDDIVTGNNILKVWLGAGQKTYILAAYVFASTGIALPNEPAESTFYAHDGFGVRDKLIIDKNRNMINIEKLGIQNTSPNFPLHINKGTGSYSPTSGVNENVFGVNSTYDAAGSQHVTFSRLDGNWLDGTTGADSAFGWLWNYQNSVRGGMMYDHRSTEQFQIFSSYAPIVFYTTDAADGNAVPTDSNMNQRMTIMPGGKVGIGTTNPVNAKVHIIGDSSYVGNYGYNTLTLEDTSGYPGLNLRTGNNNWLIRKDGGNNSLQIVNSTDASGPGTGTYNNRFTILSDGRVGIGTNSPDASLHVVGQGSFEREGNRNRGNLILGPHGSGTDKWSTLAGTHYNDASGSGNGSGAAGIMIIGSSSSSTTNKIFIGHGPYELNPATEIRLGTHTATTHSTGGTTHLTIDSTGKTIVGASSAQGIGTSSKLQVRGGAIDITDSDSGRSIRFYQNTTFRGGIGPGNWTGEGSNSSLGMYATGGDISFHHNSGTPTVRISDEGHLGLERSDASSGVTKGYPKIVYPNVHWSNSSTSTGQVRIRLPGNLNNYDMLHMELTVYEYNSTNATTIIVGGHNWNSGGAGGSTNQLWHNFGVKVIGTFTKPIYLTGDANDRYIVLGDVGSTWTYGMVSLARVHGATFYSTAFDLAGDWNIEKVTSSSYTWSSSNLNTSTSTTLATPGNLTLGNEFTVGRGNVSNNFKVKTATTGAAGITLYNSSDQWRAQLYGDGSNYGFLDANWGSWDIRKATNGAMYFNANDSYYLQPESISVLDELIVEGRRVNQKSGSLSMATGTWYTIATNSGSRASAKFHIRDTKSSRHQSVHFYASHMYGNNSAITILHNCAYSTSPYRYIRIKEGGTYDGALLQVYTDNTASYVGYIYENDQSAGWNLLGTPVPDGTDPGTVSNFAALTNVPVQLDIDTTAYGGIATSGPIWSKYDVTAYSDRRVKTNIEVIPDALEKVKKLSGYTFNRTDTKHEVKQTGVIAQEVMEVLPEAVNGDDEGGYSVAYGNMVGMLIEAVKELSAKVDVQQAEIDRLKGKGL